MIWLKSNPNGIRGRLGAHPSSASVHRYSCAEPLVCGLRRTRTRETVLFFATLSRQALKSRPDGLEAGADIVGFEDALSVSKESFEDSRILIVVKTAGGPTTTRNNATDAKSERIVTSGAKGKVT
jgi:hypothetical protein